MKRTLTISLLAIMAAALILYIGFAWREAPPRPDEKSLLLVTDDDTGWFFLQLREGAQAACREQNALLRTIVVPADAACEPLHEAQASGVLLFLSSPQMRRKAEDCLKERNIPYRSVFGQGAYAVRTDEKAGAQRLAGLIPANHTLAMVYAKEDDTTRKRIEGAQSVLGSIVPIKVDVTAPAPKELFFARACIAMDEAATIWMAEQKDEGRLPSSLLLFGYDTGSRRIQDLEKGTVYAMMMAAPYSLGHSASKSLMTGRDVPLPVGKPVLKKTMFSSENVRLMFPLIQND